MCLWLEEFSAEVTSSMFVAGAEESSTVTVPVNGSGRSSASQIIAGARRNSVKLCD